MYVKFQFQRFCFPLLPGIVGCVATGATSTAKHVTNKNCDDKLGKI